MYIQKSDFYSRMESNYDIKYISSGTKLEIFQTLYKGMQAKGKTGSR